MTRLILFYFYVQIKYFNRLMFKSEASSQKCIVSLKKNSNFRNTKWAQRPLFLSRPCFNVTTPPTKLTSQPPTSQVARQICYCLSAQYESHASSWLDRKQQTKQDQAKLVTITIQLFFLSLLDLSGPPVFAKMALVLWCVCYLPWKWLGTKLLHHLLISRSLSQ